MSFRWVRHLIFNLNKFISTNISYTVPLCDRPKDYSIKLTVNKASHLMHTYTIIGFSRPGRVYLTTSKIGPSKIRGQLACDMIDLTNLRNANIPPHFSFTWQIIFTSSDYFEVWCSTCHMVINVRLSDKTYSPAMISDEEKTPMLSPNFSIMPKFSWKTSVWRLPKFLQSCATRAENLGLWERASNPCSLWATTRGPQIKLKG